MIDDTVSEVYRLSIYVYRGIHLHDIKLSPFSGNRRQVDGIRATAHPTHAAHVLPPTNCDILFTIWRVGLIFEILHQKLYMSL